MKRGSTFWQLLVERCTFWSGLTLAVTVSVSPALATVADNPYTTIVERNAFALKDPPPPAPPLTPPTAPPPNIELRGITTLFGRPQALLNFKVPSKPPEPPKDRSLVMDVEQREGDVHVLEVNPTTGTVRLKVQGNEVSMNLKDNAPKPQFTASAALPGVPGTIPPAFPTPPGGVPAPPSGSPNISTMGGSAAPVASTRPTLPSRNLRAGGVASGAAPAVAGGFNDPVEQAAAIEVMAEKNRSLIESGKMPPPPYTGVK